MLHVDTMGMDNERRCIAVTRLSLGVTMCHPSVTPAVTLLSPYCHADAVTRDEGKEDFFPQQSGLRLFAHRAFPSEAVLHRQVTV